MNRTILTHVHSVSPSAIRPSGHAKYGVSTMAGDAHRPSMTTPANSRAKRALSARKKALIARNARIVFMAAGAQYARASRCNQTPRGRT